MTVFELKSIENKLNIIQFSVQTICTIHLLTCAQIMICTHRGEYVNTWLYNQGVHLDDHTK